jgi:hypothetical protein
MPGEFYVKGNKEKLDLTQILARLEALENDLVAVKAQTDKLAGETPGTGWVNRDWQIAESEVARVGAAGIKNKLQSLLVSIHNLAGTVITTRLYMNINGVERKVYEQAFNATTDPPGLWIVNGTLAIHDVLRVTLQSNEVADNGKAVDFDYLLEAM